MLRAAVAAFAISILASSAYAHQAVDKRLLNLIQNDDAAVPDKSAAARIRRGRNLFLNGTFGGNGRTCGTCHEPTNNFTIDPAFIATLPQSSPLFVAENNPNLRGIEDPTFVRLGLICENLDGFPVPNTLPSTATCVFRGVPHTLGLRRSIAPAEAPFPLVNATGWSGDGSPGNGAFINFALGAVVQHFPKDQRRRAGIDFRIPTKNQLADMQAFQLSLGDHPEISLDGDDGIPTLVFRDQNVEAGKSLFVNGVPGRAGNNRSCNGCHNDGGALDQAGNNRQRATGAARLSTAPACRGAAPGDGGFGQTPVFTAPVCIPAINAVFRGDQTMNTPPVIQAADTGPWFHNNAVDGQIENAVAFYTSDTFNESPSGGGNAFILNATQINQIGALLRALNAMENIRNGIVVDRRASGESQTLGAASLREARSETLDAIRVLQSSPIAIFQGTSIIRLLSEAADLEARAIGQNGSARKASINAAIAKKQQARPLFAN